MINLNRRPWDKSLLSPKELYDLTRQAIELLTGDTEDAEFEIIHPVVVEPKTIVQHCTVPNEMKESIGFPYPGRQVTEDADYQL